MSCDYEFLYTVKAGLDPRNLTLKKNICRVFVRTSNGGPRSGAECVVLFVCQSSAATR